MGLCTLRKCCVSCSLDLLISELESNRLLPIPKSLCILEIHRKNTFYNFYKISEYQGFNVSVLNYY